MQLTLSKSSLRSYRPEDVPSLTRYAGAYGVARNLTRMPHPYSPQDAEAWIAWASAQAPESHFAIALRDEAVGGIGLRLDDPERHGVFRHSAELGYWLGEPFWGHGIMTEAVSALVDWAFTALDLVRIHAAVYARNPASARVLAKAGFDFQGRLRAQYFKEGEFQRRLALRQSARPAHQRAHRRASPLAPEGRTTVPHGCMMGQIRVYVPTGKGA